MFHSITNSKGCLRFLLFLNSARHARARLHEHKFKLILKRHALQIRETFRNDNNNKKKKKTLVKTECEK